MKGWAVRTSVIRMGHVWWPLVHGHVRAQREKLRAISLLLLSTKICGYNTARPMSACSVEPEDIRGVPFAAPQRVMERRLNFLSSQKDSKTQTAVSESLCESVGLVARLAR